jgi:zinc transport system substrate-binding protein
MIRYIIPLAAASLFAPAPAARAEAPLVVTDIPPVHSLVAQVMGEVGAPVLLLDPGADPHDFQLRPSQAQAVAGAGLIVWMGPQMSPWLDRAAAGLAPGAVALDLLAVEGTVLRDFGDAAAGHDHEGHDHEGHDHEGHADGEHAGGAHAGGAQAGGAHAHEGHADEGHADAGHAADGHAEDDGAGHAGHAHHGTDPHAWLDPGNAALWLDAIAAELARIDPPNATAYAANAAAAAARLAALDAELAAALAPLRDRPFVVVHDAYGYFTDHFGLPPAAAIALGDATSPGAQRLAALRDELAAGGRLCVFPEANHDAALAAGMAEAAGARLGAALDPEGTMLDPGPELYAAMLRGMAAALTDCLGAGG